jgi:hypothetical protein
MATTTEKIEQFYKTFNQIIKDQPTGVKWQIAEAMYYDVAMSLQRYRNPLAGSVLATYEEMASDRQEYKKEMAQRFNRGPAEITVPQESTSADGGKVA